MSEPSAVVEATPTEVVMEVDRGPLVNLTGEQRAEFRRTGELPKAPEPPKKEEAAASSETEQVETAGDPEPPKQQEKPAPKPKKTADDRIAQLEATIEKIRKGAGIEKTQKVESSPAKVEQPKQPANPQNYQEWRKEFKAAEWEAKYIADHPEVKDYAEVSAAMADYLSEVREEFRSAERTRQAQAREFDAKIAAAESRYENFKDVAEPFAGEILADNSISPVIKQMFRDSDIMPDLIFTIGKSEQDRSNFLKMAKENPGKAIRYIALTESLIAEELAGKTAKAEEPPAKPKTQAPRPPSEAGGRAAAPPDALEAAAVANDMRAFKAEANRRALAKLKS